MITIKYLNGRSVKVSLDKSMKDAYKDEYTTEALPKEETKAAMHDELT